VVEVDGLFFAARVDWSIPPGNGGERVSPRQMWALSTYDARHMVNAWYVWELPVGKGKRFLNQANRLTDALLGGWQLSGIWTQSSVSVAVRKGAKMAAKWRHARSELFPLDGKVCYRTARSGQGRAVAGRGVANP